MYTSELYSTYPTLILGFHGCDKAVGEKLLRGEAEHLTKSTNDYDWLGHGIYFWENSPSRAEEFARSKKDIAEPFIIGAVIDLGTCLDLTDYENIQLLTDVYNELETEFKELAKPMPSNIAPKGSSDKLVRRLDCAVIENVHRLNAKMDKSFDSVRGLFTEGEEAYPNAGFNKKTHIQLCIRNTKCIKGYFRAL